MVQFYALSVFINFVAGLVLVFESKEDKPASISKISEIVKQKSVMFTMGILALVVGILKILSPTAGDIPVVGDIVPALTSLLVGGVLLIDFFKSGSELTSETVDRIHGIFQQNRKYIGMAAIVTAFLHFLMPGVPIL